MGLGGTRGARVRNALALAAVVTAFGGTATAVAASPHFTVDDVSVTEGTGPGGTPAQATFTVTLDGTVPPGGATVRYRTSALTATDGVDFTPVVDQVTLSFPEDALTTRSQTVTVPVAGDATNEYDEAFQLVLSNQFPAGLVGITDPLGVATIVDDDAPPAVSVADTQFFEGTNNFTLMTFTVTLSAPSGKTVKVDWTTNPGTALDTGANADYTPPNPPVSTLTFLPGVVSVQVSVQVTGDAVDEVDETFGLTLSNPRNNPNPPNPVNGPDPSIADGAAVATIQDDDGPTMNIADATVTEGGPGTSQVVNVVVALSATSPDSVGFSYTTGDDSAKAPGDYDAVTTAVPVLIPAGSLTATIPITVRGDDLDEVDEAFKVNLTTPVHGTITRSTGVVTVKDGNPSPAITVADAVVAEGTGGTKAVTLTARLTPASGRAMQVRYATRDGSATAGVDYQQSSEVLTFAPGETAKDFTVAVAPDDELEEDETFAVDVTYTVGDGPPIAPASVTIVDDDLTAANTPTLSVGDAGVREGSGGSTDAVFTVALSAPLTRAVSVRYATENGTAKAPGDFTAGDGTLTFPVGTTKATIRVPVRGDTVRELNEDFRVVLSSPRNARLVGGRGQGVITDDDAGGGPITVAPKRVAAASLLCRAGRSCPGLLVAWKLAARGTIRVVVSATLPDAGSAAKKGSSAAKPTAKPPKATPLVLLQRLLKVTKVGAGALRVRMGPGKAASTLLRRLRAAKVKALTVTVTFTNSTGAAQKTTVTVPLRF